jgi:hypothetical protein
MSTDRNQAEIARRTRRYWFEDGLVEIGMGVLFASIALVFSIVAVATAGGVPSPYGGVGLTILVLLLLSGSLAIRPAIQAAKDRVTYPRTGYVAYRRPFSTGAVAVVAALVVTVAIVTGPVAGSLTAADRIIAVQALTLAAIPLIAGARSGLGRLYLVAVVIVAVGVVAEVVSLGQYGQMALLYGGAAMALTLSGLWALRSYLRRTSAPDREPRS